jgi:ATP-dependent RNA helicase RhlE
MSVDSIGLPEQLLTAVKAYGYKTLTPIQQRAIPVMRKGHDLIASAQTGTGKTAAFSLPMLEKLLKSAPADGQHTLRALILTPTRELAQQVYTNIKAYSQHTSLTSAVVYGGVGMASQTKAIKAGLDILIATPGRLLEHLALHHLSLSSIQCLVLDEADRMLDMGFLKEIEQILQGIKQKHQTALFSATFSAKVKSLANQILVSPISIETAKQNTTSGKVKQSVYWVSEARKRELLAELIGVNNWQQVLVFAGTRESANELAKELVLDGIPAALCHGEKSQGARNKALAQFSSGKVRVLVATDVAARGLDIADLPYVVNFHLPFLAEDYVHRIGRTGRAGKTGTAISLVSPKDEKFLQNIEQLIGRRFERIVMPGYEFELELTSKRNKTSTTAKPEAKNRYQARLAKNRQLADKNKENSTNSAGQRGKTGNKSRRVVKSK